MNGCVPPAGALRRTLRIVLAALVWCGISVAQSNNASQPPAPDSNAQAVVVDRSSPDLTNTSDARVADAQGDHSAATEATSPTVTDVAKDE